MLLDGNVAFIDEQEVRQIFFAVGHPQLLAQSLANLLMRFWNLVAALFPEALDAFLLGMIPDGAFRDFEGFRDGTKAVMGLGGG